LSAQYIDREEIWEVGSWKGLGLEIPVPGVPERFGVKFQSEEPV
jgi:hypothetical protein